MKINKKLLFFGILILAGVLRIWKLDSVPALNADEVAIGYNAYSLIQTGKDEHGNPWPVHFQSFNDYKPGLYFYIVLPFVKFFGLNEWTVRFPAALLAISTVAIVYWLVKEQFKNEKLALISSFLLAISPWHIHFSRGGWEVNVGTFFLVLGIWLFIKALRDSRFYILSFVSLVASLYTYHAVRLVIPLLGVGFLIVFWKRVKKDWKKVMIAGLISLVLLIPLIKDLTTGSMISRAAGVGLLADPGPFSRINEQRGEHLNPGGYTAKLLHNRPVNYGLAFLENWLEHFEGNFLFISGDEIQRNKVPEFGQMYVFEILLLLVGLVAIARKSKNLSTDRQDWTPILLWLLMAPTAAALTFQSPHALRAHNMVIPLTIVSGYGLFTIIEWLYRWPSARKYWRLGIIIVLIILMAWQFIRYQHMYWLHMAKEYPYSSQYGVKELVNYIKKEGNRFEKIYVTDRYDQPYIFFLFYLKYSPEKFQNEHQLTSRDEFGFSTVREFDKFWFERIDWNQLRDERKVLLVGTDEELPIDANVVHWIRFPNGETAFEIVPL